VTSPKAVDIYPEAIPISLANFNFGKLPEISLNSDAYPPFDNFT
jgi:hypothetical protein